jgi:YbbR domain-containing protein
MMQHRVKKHGLKFVSAFLAMFLWVYVLNSERVKFEKTVGLDYLLPEDLVFVDKPAQEVTFLIEGPRAFVRSVAEREDRLQIDLNRLNPGKRSNLQIDINPTQLNLPFGMVVERVLPRRLSLRMEKKVSKTVPLKLQLAGSLPEKLSLTNTELIPSEVEITGPKSLIAKLKRVTTRPIDQERLIGQEQVPVEVQLDDERLSLGKVKTPILTYQLKAASANFVLKDHPVRFLTQAKNVTSTLKGVTVRLLVPEKILKNQSNISSSVQVWADIPDGVRGKMEVPLKVVLPPSIHLLEVSPKTIIVNVQ